MAKYKAKRRQVKKVRDWGAVPTLLFGIYLFLLPFVTSLSGYDNFRLPKEVFSIFSILLIAAACLLFRSPRIEWRLWSWEALFAGAILYLILHTVLIGGGPLGWSGLWSVLIFSLLFVSARQLVSFGIQRRIWLGVAVALAVNGILTVLQYYGLVPFMLTSAGSVLRGRLNAAGLIGEVNSGGLLFGLILILLVPWVVTETHSRIRALAVILMAANLLGLLYTRTLTAMAALAISLVLWLLLHHWWLWKWADPRRSRRLVARLWIVILAVGLMVGVVATQAGLTDRVTAVIRQAENRNWNVATAGRQPVYWITWQMILEEPWVGRGLNTFARDFFKVRTQSSYGQSVRLIDQPGAFQEAHNEYLQVWEELGIAALLMFLLLLGIPLVRSLSLLRSESDPRRAYWIGTLGIALVYVAVGCVTFFPLHLSVTAAYIVFLVACMRFFQTGEILAPARNPGTASGFFRDPRRVALLAVLLVVVVWVGLRQRDKLRANQELAVVVTLVDNTLQPNLPARQKLIFAQEAMRRLDQIESWHPRLWQVHNLRGTAHLVRGQVESAIESFNRAAELVPSPEIYTNLAAAYLAQQRNEAAREALQVALRYNPSYQKARQALRQLESTDGG